MNADFFNALDLLEKEKGIPKEYMIEKVEAALANACRKEVGPTAVVRVQLDQNKNDFRVFWQRNVVADGEVTDPKVEISLSDARTLGVKAPVRESGDIAGTPGCTIKVGENTVEIAVGI